MITVYTKGGGKVQLDDTKPLGCGGEGTVYLKGKLTYKIFHDPVNMIPNQKIVELSPLAGSNVIVPLETISRIKNGKPVGFTAHYVKNAVAMARLFTNSYRKKNNITPEKTVDLVENLLNMLKTVHDNNVLIVDVNEFNFLVSEKDQVSVFGIDTSSYQTPSFPATAIMPHIRDWETTGFTVFSDYFSAAIIAMQLFVGEHPFKGDHSGFAKNDFKGRQLAHLSILNPSVKVRGNVRPFGLIPTQFLDWFTALFEKGLRCLPPDSAGAFYIETVQTKFVEKDGVFVISLIGEYDGNIRWFKSTLGKDVCLTDTHLYIEGRKIKCKDYPDIDVIFSPITGTPLAARIEEPKISGEENGIVKIVNINSNAPVIGVTLSARKKFVVDNRLYIISDTNITEVEAKEMGNNIVTAVVNSWPINGIGSEIFEGFIYTSLMGKPYLVIPYENKRCSTLPIPELDGYRVVDGKYQKGICVIIGMSKDGTYDRIVIDFNAEHDGYEYTIEKDIPTMDVNYTVTDNGIIIMFDENDNIVLFTKENINDRKVVKDCNVNAGFTLCKAGSNVRMYSGNQLWSISMTGK